MMARGFAAVEVVVDGLALVVDQDQFLGPLFIHLLNAPFTIEAHVLQNASDID